MNIDAAMPLRGSSWQRRAAVGVLAVLLAVVGAIGSATAAISVGSVKRAYASTISGDKAAISNVDTQYLAEEGLLHKYSGQYDQEQYIYQGIVAKLKVEESDLVTAQDNQAKTLVDLRRAAVNAYINQDTSLSSFSTLFGSNPNTYMIQSEISHVASSQLSSDIDSYVRQEHSISRMEKVLVGERNSASAALASINQDKIQAQAAANKAIAELNSLKGNLKQLEAIRQQQLAAQAAAAAQVAAQLAAQRAAQAAQQAAQAPSSNAPGGGGGGPGGGGAPAPSGSFAQQAAVAVQTALAQVGKPYVWGGASPSVGFDCSGLVMYAWGVAGVSLPHYSVAQYNDVTPVSSSQLQPGDIVFYYSPYESAQPGHEALYIGNGQVVQAADQQYGILVTSLTWAGNPIGYGQP